MAPHSSVVGSTPPYVCLWVLQCSIPYWDDCRSRSITRPYGLLYPRLLHRRMRTTREMFAHVKSLGSRACGRVLCSPNHTFVSHPMISEHWDECCRRNLEASSPTKARSEPTDRAKERLRCPLCVRRTFVFHVPELACTLCRKWSHARRRIVLATGMAVCNHLGLPGCLRRTLYTLRASPVPCAAVTEHT